MNCPQMVNVIRTKAIWRKPCGYDTGINIYSCVAKEKVPLILKQKGVVSWYTCGPTVYDEAHVGHASCYMKIDIIQRILSKYFNFNLISAMNITDIDDKIIKRSKETNEAPDVITSLYEKHFWEDLAKLNINKPDVILRVSENIACIQDFIKCLMSKNLAYQSKDQAVYFQTVGINCYGKLVNVKKSDEIANDTRDFVLWKKSKPNEPFWPSPWGSGRPGWHVECSALASKVFGSSIDIHAGGMDLKFPHHENEEAQSCGYHGCSQWVNYWLHVGQLQTKSFEKMSKSLKNTISINYLLQQNKADDFRLACLMSHYRSQMEYSPELMKMANRTLKKYRDFMDKCCSYILRNDEMLEDEGVIRHLLPESREQLYRAFCDDFNTPEVINILNKIVKVANPLVASKGVSIVTIVGLRNFIQETLDLFNISEAERIVSEASAESEILHVLKDFRQKVRLVGLDDENGKILQLCDDLRSTLRSKGIDIKDFDKYKLCKT